MFQFSIAIGAFIWGLAFQSNPQQPYVLKGAAQGTSYTIKYYADRALIEKKSIDSIFNVIDQSMSLYRTGSLINQFNAGKVIKMDTHLQKVMKQALILHKETDGLMDVTIGPLTQLWGFGAKKVNRLPSKVEVEEALKLVGMQFLEVKGNKLSKNSTQVKIDLNGIAQGYTVDVVADFLKKKKVKAFMVELGGEIYVYGRKPDQSKFKIAIEGPEADSGGLKTLELEHAAVTTSGNYRQTLAQQEANVHHLIHPKTGYPFKNELLSVTVYAKSGILADGYDNALMGMGLEKALALLRKKPGIEAYFIYKDANGKLRDTLTNGFKTKIIYN